MSARKKASNEEPLTDEEKERLKSLLERLKESPGAVSGEEEDQPGEEEEGLTEEEIRKLDELLGPPTWQQVQLFRKAGRTIAKRAAIAQIIEAMPDGIDTCEAYARGAMPFASFLPSDGTELSLSRLSVAATNAAMDCFTRAANTGEIKVRELELNSATKLALATAALCKALDHHRGPDWREYIDDTLPPRRPTTADILKAAESDPKDEGEKNASDNGNGKKHDGDPKPKEEPRPKVKARSRSST